MRIVLLCSRNHFIFLSPKFYFVAPSNLKSSSSIEWYFVVFFKLSYVALLKFYSLFKFEPSTKVYFTGPSKLNFVAQIKLYFAFPTSISNRIQLCSSIKIQFWISSKINFVALFKSSFVALTSYYLCISNGFLHCCCLKIKLCSSHKIKPKIFFSQK